MHLLPEAHLLVSHGPRCSCHPCVMVLPVQVRASYPAATYHGDLLVFFFNIKLIILTIFKCTALALSTFTLLCDHHHRPVSRTFSSF